MRHKEGWQARLRRWGRACWRSQYTVILPLTALLGIVLRLGINITTREWCISIFVWYVMSWIVQTGPWWRDLGPRYHSPTTITVDSTAMFAKGDVIKSGPALDMTVQFIIDDTHMIVAKRVGRQR